MSLCQGVGWASPVCGASASRQMQLDAASLSSPRTARRKSLLAAVKAGELGVKLALLGSVRPQVLAAAALACGTMQAQAKLWPEARQAAGTGYRAAAACGDADKQVWVRRGAGAGGGGVKAQDCERCTTVAAEGGEGGGREGEGEGDERRRPV